MFKVGDKVKCIRNDKQATRYLVLNQIYTISYINEAKSHVSLVGVHTICETGDWFVNRFELISKSKSLTYGELLKLSREVNV